MPFFPLFSHLLKGARWFPRKICQIWSCVLLFHSSAFGQAQQKLPRFCDSFPTAELPQSFAPFIFFSFYASPACCEFQKCNISLQMSHSTPQKHPSSRKGIPVRISCFHFSLICCSVVTRREPPLPYFLIVLTRQCFSDYFGAEMFSVCALEDLGVSAEACIATGLSAGEQEAEEGKHSAAISRCT